MYINTKLRNFLKYTIGLPILLAMSFVILFMFLIFSVLQVLANIVELLIKGETLLINGKY